MPTATLTLPATAEQARTARLVAGAAARRAGLSDSTVDDVRLAVSEAMARSVARAAGNPTGSVRLDLTDDQDLFRIAVTDGQDVDPGDEDNALALALIRALVPHATVVDSDPGQSVVLSWPTPG